MLMTEEVKEPWLWPEGLHFLRTPIGLRRKLGAKGEKGFDLWECLAEFAGSGGFTFPKQETIEKLTGLPANQQYYWASKLSEMHDDSGRPYLEVIRWASTSNIGAFNVYVLYPFVGMVTDEQIKTRLKGWGQRYRTKPKPEPDVPLAEHIVPDVMKAAEQIINRVQPPKPRTEPDDLEAWLEQYDRDDPRTWGRVKS